MDPAIIAALGGPVVTAIVAGLGLWLREVRSRRNRDLAYERALKQAQDQTTFIEGWLQAHERVAGTDLHEAARRRASEDLERAYALVDRSLVEVRRSHEPLTLRRVAGALFLLGPAQSGRARRNAGLAVAYYCSLAWAVVCTGGSAAFAFGDFDTDGSAEPLSMSGSIWLGVCCLSAALPLAILPAWLLHRALAWRSDRGSAAPPDWQVMPQPSSGETVPDHGSASHRAGPDHTP